ncbi:NAD(+)/NADH kinase [Halobacterium litoreum]|uniref:ATP-NAD kinase n=1 Tax=Halobacterium litoreum TaxID=2039234 RepID=A0ABD5NIH4_9EURY|nr:ATP-NAD kinase [Halobacterium litoreum]UHH12473.1 ATP-NAD kinase [Halobacterium litoreum]
MTRVGLLGAAAADAADAVRDAGGTPLVDDTADADVLAALDEDALLDAAFDATAPILPVGVGREYGGVADTDRAAALAALAAGDYDVTERPTLSVTTESVDARALADATLVASETGDISEFGVRSDGRELDDVRADGVVAATPVGSRGYAADADGPVVNSDVDAVAVVPIAPFRIERTNWVVSPPASLTVVRDEAAVDLYVDGRRRGALAPHDPVTLDWGDPVSVATVSRSGHRAD